MTAKTSSPSASRTNLSTLELERREGEGRTGFGGRRRLEERNRGGVAFLPRAGAEEGLKHPRLNPSTGGLTSTLRRGT